MAHNVNLLIGPRAALRPFLEAAPSARMFALTPSAPLFVLPLTDEVLDALHTRHGTGEWLDFDTQESAPRITSTDMVFAAAASRNTALVWIYTGYFGGPGEQAACAWIDGALALKPTIERVGQHLPPALSPINCALRLLGVKAGGTGAGDDEFTALGLGQYRSNEEVLERALPVS